MRLGEGWYAGQPLMRKISPGWLMDIDNVAARPKMDIGVKVFACERRAGGNAARLQDAHGLSLRVTPCPLPQLVVDFILVQAAAGMGCEAGVLCPCRRAHRLRQSAPLVVSSPLR